MEIHSFSKSILGLTIIDSKSSLLLHSKIFFWNKNYIPKLLSNKSLKSSPVQSKSDLQGSISREGG